MDWMYLGQMQLLFCDFSLRRLALGFLGTSQRVDKAHLVGCPWVAVGLVVTW